MRIRKYIGFTMMIFFKHVYTFWVEEMFGSLTSRVVANLIKFVLL